MSVPAQDQVTANPLAREGDVEAFLRTIGKRVRLLRLTRELTQADLAQAAGMSRSFVSLIEHGSHGIDIVRLYHLAAALRVPLTDLLRSTAPDQPSAPGSTDSSDPTCWGTRPTL